MNLLIETRGQDEGSDLIPVSIIKQEITVFPLELFLKF